MAEAKTSIVIAIIGLVGTLGVAIIGKMDPFSPRRPDPPSPPRTEASETRDYYITLASFCIATPGSKAQAEEQLKIAKERGFEIFTVLDSVHVRAFVPGYWTVVAGPYSRDDANSHLAKVILEFPNAQKRNRRAPQPQPPGPAC